MTTHRDSRREFIRHLACLAASGGAAALVPQLRMIGTALAATSRPSTLPGYKALVCVYLDGGNDAWNTLVPYDTARYDVYADSRGGVYNATSNSSGLALKRPSAGAETNAQKITDSASGLDYFVHPSLPEMKALYDQNHVAFIGNVGTLVRPITKAEYNANTLNRPPQLYSHSNQKNLWHVGTSVDSRYGWGGGSVGLLQPQFTLGNDSLLSPCISISGNNKFEVGHNIVPYRMSSSSSGTSNPLPKLSGVCNPTGCTGFSGQRDVALNQLLTDTYSGAFASEYERTFKRGRDIFALLYDGLNSENGQVSTPFPSNNSLASQLLSVARMIKLSRSQQYAARQVYYVSTGGFDLHSGLMSTGTSGHAALLTKVSQALSAFAAAMQEINAFNDVTTFTMSEFARTLSSNGNGSDHGWGSVQMAMGGSVTGGRLYLDGGGQFSGFPDQTLNNDGNFSRGQFIPGIGMDQYAATLAYWLGVTSASDLAAIFPNLGNFNSAFHNLGFV